MKSLAAFTILILLCGCYPVYKTLQPSARVHVKDEIGKPVSAASVILISSSYPYGQERSRQIVMSSISGAAEFPSINEWRIESLMIHGIESFFWNWRILKPGYETIITANNSGAQFESEPNYVMKKGESKSCPEF